eukprot:GFUD01040871.1.p1 GENE.GFUD01040871.1~~GFUD01040871.1.p1  ORF type:complete len:583 (+),score=176.45 GFUD01040871.1:60-1751(+)
MSTSNMVISNIMSTSNMVIDNFQHEREELYVCYNCKAETRNKFYDIAILCDMSSTNRTSTMSLQQLLEQSMRKEEREKRCEECGCEKATTTRKLVKLPKVLIIILKRYRYNHQDLAPSGKVSRLVHIPETVSLTSLIAKTVTLPSTKLPDLLPHQSAEVTIPLPTPRKTPHTVTPVREIPGKFKGLTVVQLSSLNEEDQMEYMLHLSENEALAMTRPAGEEVDEDLKAATPRKTPHTGPLARKIPVKFKGLTELQVGNLSEEDLMEYMLHFSENDALAMTRQARDEVDEDLKAALEASIREKTPKQTHTLSPETEPSRGVSDTDPGESSKDSAKHVGQERRRTPARKRSFGQLGGGVFTSGGGGDSDKLDRALEYVASREVAQEPKRGVKQGGRKTYSKVVKGKERNDSAQKMRDYSVCGPTSPQEEESDLKQALALSMLESEMNQKDPSSDKLQGDLDDTDNNNSEEVTRTIPADTATPGQAQHSYQLSSVVSHYGASASSGHYVADVYRFDGGGWYRYDDTRVTRTDSRSVRTGSNSANGYILTYLYQPLWEESQSRGVGN